MPEKSVLAPYRSQLGTVPDQQIADAARVSRTLVVNYRKKHGIPAYDGHRAAGAPIDAAAAPAGGFRGRRSALDAFVDQLGRVPDAEIARLAGVTAENVRAYRKRRGIVAERAGGPGRASPKEGAPRGTAPPAGAPTVETGAAGARVAYLVRVETDAGPRTWALIAPDVATAALVATRWVNAHHPDATLRAIERVAEVLPG